MSRTTYGAVAVLVALLPGVWFSDGYALTISVPAEVPIAFQGPVEITLPVLLFAGIPTLFTLFMIVEATGHIRERKPPS